jgi:hypothetical protein
LASPLLDPSDRMRIGSKTVRAPSAPGVVAMLGGASILIGVIVLVYAHAAMARDLQRSVDLGRRVISDAIDAVGVLSNLAVSTDAIRERSEEVTRRSATVLRPGVDMLDAVADALRVIPGAEGSSAAESKGAGSVTALPEQLRRTAEALKKLTAEARALRTSTAAVAVTLDRHPPPSLRPTLDVADARLSEAQALLHDANPARGITLMVDLIAGVYVVIGAALLAVARGMRTAGSSKRRGTPSSPWVDERDESEGARVIRQHA